MALHYVEHRPGPALRPHLECLWLVSDPRPRERRAPERIVPDGCPELIVHLGDPFSRRVGGRWRRQRRAFLAGTLTRPWLLRAGRRVATLGVRFRPGEVTPLLPASMAAAAGRETPLASIVGRSRAQALAEALARARGAAARFAAAEDWLAAQLALTGRRTAATARPAVRALLETRGTARIADVARSLGWTRRRLERAFARELGIRPKLFARIVRLNAVLAGLDAAERASAVDLALGAGYFDQAHLLKDFRVLAGRTPRGGGGRDGELARNFTHPERLRALLAGE
jgi:AraC-like DNA-binding protein